MKLLLSAWFAALLSASLPAAAAVWLSDYPVGTLSGMPAPVPADWNAVPALPALPVESLAEDARVLPSRAELPLNPPPVPEPMLVVMLACGMLLIMPGAFLAEWSRLGDRRHLLGGNGP